MFCDHSESGGVPVEAVRAPEDERNALFAEVVHESVCEGVSVVVEGRMDRHAGRLVDDQDISVLVDDIQRQLHRRDIRG